MMRWGKLWRRVNAVRFVTHLIALWKLAWHRNTPRPARLGALAVLAYAISPIDLIPDFIPFLGQIDDLILIPLGIAGVVKLTPAPLWQARLLEAQAQAGKLAKLKWAIAFVVGMWLLGLVLLLVWIAA